MTNYKDNEEKSFDFSPDLILPKENVKAESLSISIDKHNSSALQRLQDYGIDVNDYANKVLAEHFKLDTSIPKDVKGLKTSINFDGDTAMRLKNLKENGINTSNYVNKVVSEHLRLERELEKDVYKKCTGNFTRVEILVHKDVAVLLEWLKLNKGAIPLANKLAEVIANDSHYQCEFLRGDCNCYGVNTLETALNTIRRAFGNLE